MKQLCDKKEVAQASRSAIFETNPLHADDGMGREGRAKKTGFAPSWSIAGSVDIFLEPPIKSMVNSRYQVNVPAMGL